MITINKLPPFKQMCMTIGNLPSSFMESMTYYEALEWLYKYLGDEVIPNVNNTNEAVIELQNNFTILENYVNNYFDNLDVQEEINNKLDEMAESGELTDIIAQYLGLAGMLTFNTVADMKIADNLSNGSICQTLGYYNINDGGKAIYKIHNTIPTSYYENIDSGLYAELITDIADIRKFGAKGNGTDDDAPSIRNAINYLKSKEKTILYFPKGIYYINSGDPRGLSTADNYSKNDYYTCFEVINNMKIIGDGNDSVLLYNSNRLGYNLISNKGDVGAIFANFRVNSTDNYAVSGLVEIKNLKVTYTVLEEGEKNIRDYIDGQLIRVNTNNVSSPDLWTQNYNGSFNFENITIENATGHQIFNVSGGNKVTANNVNIHNIGKINNTANTDHSSFFINAQLLDINNCQVYCDSQSTGTAFECHSTNCFITNCYTKYISRFTNLVGNVNGYAGNYEVSNNICKNNKSFIAIWPLPYKYYGTIKVHDNIITLSYKTSSDSEAIVKMQHDGSYTGTENPIETFEFYNNYCTTNITDSTTVNTATNADSAMLLSMIKNIKINHNRFTNFRRGLIFITERTLACIKDIEINNNIIEKIGLLTQTSYNVTNILITLPASYLSNNIKKLIYTSNNIINCEGRNAISGTITGIYYNLRTGGSDNNTEYIIQHNDIKYATTEVNIHSTTTDGYSVGGITFIHKYNNEITNILASLNSSNELSCFKTGTQIEGNIGNDYVKAFINANAQYKIEMYVDNAAPTSGGYFRKGSIAYNYNPSFTSLSPYAWICTTAGTAGSTAVWSPINPTIE